MTVIDRHFCSVRTLVKTCLALTLLAGLAACTSRGIQQEMTSCTFPDTARTPAPSFICDQQVEGYPITRLTSSEASDVDTNERLERARLEVQHTLALEWLMLWFPDVVEGQESEAQQVILAWLDEELRVVRSRASSSGTMWLLLGIAYSEVDAQVILRNRFAAAGIKTIDR